MIKKLSADIIVSIGFLITLSVPMLISIYEPDEKISHSEKRPLNVWPTYSKDISIVAYTNGISGYVKDHFGFRSDMIRIYNRLKLNLGESPTDNTVIGKQGWLFYKTQDPLTSLTIDRHEIEKNLVNRRDQIIKLNKSLKVMGVEYQFLVAPNKMSIYPQFLPNSFQMTEIGATFKEFTRLLDSMDDDILFDAHKVLNDAKKLPLSSKLYFKHDTHWNALGAFKVSQSLTTYLSEKFPKLKFKSIEHDFVEKNKLGGDLATFIGLRKELSNIEPITTSPRCARRSHLIEVRPGLVKNKCAVNKTTMLFIGDSFMTAIAPYLAESVGTFIMVEQGISEKELIDIVNEVKPDIVIDELVERNLAKPNK